MASELITRRLGGWRAARPGMIFVPALDEQEQRVFLKHWIQTSAADLSESISERVAWDSSDFAFGGWLPTARTLLAMARCTGFRVVDCGQMWNGDALSVLLEVSD